MLEKHQDLLDMLLEIIRTRYADDISIMIIYGSCVNGSYNEKSDLDMFFIPKTKRGRNLSKTFILDGIGYDLWGADWGTLERFANYDDMKVSVIAGSQLVYCASEPDRQRYETLKQKAKSVESGTLTRDLYGKAEEHLAKAAVLYAAFCKKQDLAEVGGILVGVCNTVCLLNHTYLHFGSKQTARELAALDKLPVDFISAYTAVVEDIADAKQNCALLIETTGQFLQCMNSELPAARKHPLRKIAGRVSQSIKKKAAPSTPDLFGLYEEISSHWNKIRLSCAKEDALYAFLSAASLQHTLNDVQKGLGISVPPLCFIDKFDAHNLQKFVLEANKAEDAFLELLRGRGISIAYYDKLDQLRALFA